MPMEVIWGKCICPFEVGAPCDFHMPYFIEAEVGFPGRARAAARVVGESLWPFMFTGV
jgi:hypothetical protein